MVGDLRRWSEILANLPPYIGTELVHYSWNCHLDVCAPLRELAWSNADLIIPDLRLCQAGPMFDGHVIDVYHPVLRASAMQHLGIRWIER